MKILLLVDDYFPNSIKVAAVMMHELAKELQSQGHVVTVCTPDVTLSQKFLIDEYDGVRILRFKLGAIKNVSKIKRAINETLLSYIAWRDLKGYFTDNKHDLVVSYSPTIFFGGLVKKLKSIWGCKTYLILRDFFPQWAVDNDLIKDGSLIHRYFKYFEAISYKAADIIAVQSPSNKEYFLANDHYYEFKDKLDILYNWSDSNINIDNASEYRNKLGLEDKVVFFYGGNIGHAQDMMNIVKLAQSLSDYPQAHFLLVGQGDEVSVILDAVNQGNIKNLTYLESVNQQEYQKMLMEFDIGLFSLHRNHKTHNFPGKLLGYMKYSKPILGSVNVGNDLKKVITDSGAGFVTVNGEDEILTSNAIKLLESIERRKLMGANSRTLLKNTFSVTSSAKKITGIFDR
ncbi:MAG: glycosyltransferase family 4 protein [Methylococcales bacterium]